MYFAVTATKSHLDHGLRRFLYTAATQNRSVTPLLATDSDYSLRQYLHHLCNTKIGEPASILLTFIRKTKDDHLREDLLETTVILDDATRFTNQGNTLLNIELGKLVATHPTKWHNQILQPLNRICYEKF